MIKINPKPEGYAFWYYDQYPYLLGGQIGCHPTTKSWRMNLSVYIPSYGHHVLPKFCLNEAEGRALLLHIEYLRSRARVMREVMQRELNDFRAAGPLGQLDPRK